MAYPTSEISIAKEVVDGKMKTKKYPQNFAMEYLCHDGVDNVLEKQENVDKIFESDSH